MKKALKILKFFWYFFQKPILISTFIVMCYYNTDRLILVFKNSADLIARQAGVSVSEHVIVVESKKPVPKRFFPKAPQLPGQENIAPDEGFMWPVTGPITSPFGLRWGGEEHHGIDIAVPSGTKVACAKDGFVCSEGWSNIYGNFVQVDHGNGITTLYGHNTKVLVPRGMPVKQGDVLALSGSTGRSTGPHVHFEIRVQARAVNPLTFAFDGRERKRLAARQLAQAFRKDKAQESPAPETESASSDEIKRKYLMTIEKTKKLKIAEIQQYFRDGIKAWGRTIALQYQVTPQQQLEFIRNLPKHTGATAINNLLVSFSELLPILAAQIETVNNPQSMVVKEIKSPGKS